ncbi:PREDICTED: uncharacterized protein LOC106809042 [Priapulus caudatus]|uniref:Uncharacterized protein LOC106809042 n=1 Tax=Priapulus caudatus TaxID=37621 RepID=A0ABM1E5K0_PRICU|nr:PREDICTED: uncharacterized protein LOC106809042 [Priapulus caudatus]
MDLNGKVGRWFAASVIEREGKLVPLSALTEWRSRNGRRNTESESSSGDVKQTTITLVSPTSVEDHPDPVREVCWDLDQRGSVGEMVVHLCLLAASRIHLDLAKRILHIYPKLINDIYVGEEYYGESLLHMAIMNEDPVMVRYLLDHGVCLHERCCGSFFTPNECKQRRGRMFQHVLEIEREIYWIYGKVTCASYPLEYIDSISPSGQINRQAVLALIIYGDKPEHLDMMDGLLSELLQRKWNTFAKFRFLKQMIIFGIYFTIFMLAFLLRPGPPITNCPLGRTTATELSDPGSPAWCKEELTPSDASWKPSLRNPLTTVDVSVPASTTESYTQALTFDNPPKGRKASLTIDDVRTSAESQTQVNIADTPKVPHKSRPEQPLTTANADPLAHPTRPEQPLATANADPLALLTRPEQPLTTANADPLALPARPEQPLTTANAVPLALPTRPEMSLTTVDNREPSSTTQSHNPVTSVTCEISDKCYLRITTSPEDIVRLPLELLTLGGACCYLLLAGREIGYQGLASFLSTLMTTPARAIFLVSCALIMFMVPARIFCWCESEYIMAVLAVLTTAPYWLFFCRGFKKIGPFVVMIYKMIKGDLLRFVTIYMIFLMGASQGIHPFDKPEHLDMMDGLLSELLQRKWNTFAKFRFLKQMIIFGIYFTIFMLAFLLRPGPPITNCPLGRTTATELSDPGSPAWCKEELTPSDASWKPSPRNPLTTVDVSVPASTTESYTQALTFDTPPKDPKASLTIDDVRTSAESQTQVNIADTPKVPHKSRPEQPLTTGNADPVALPARPEQPLTTGNADPVALPARPEQPLTTGNAVLLALSTRPEQPLTSANADPLALPARPEQPLATANADPLALPTQPEQPLTTANADPLALPTQPEQPLTTANADPLALPTRPEQPLTTANADPLALPARPEQPLTTANAVPLALPTRPEQPLTTANADPLALPARPEQPLTTANAVPLALPTRPEMSLTTVDNREPSSTTQSHNPVTSVTCEISDKCYLRITTSPEDIVRLPLELLTLGGACCYLLLAGREIGYQGLASFLSTLMTTPARAIFLVSCALIMFMLPARIFCWCESEYIMAVLAVLTTAPYWLFFCRGFKKIGPFVVMIYKMIKGDLLRFVTIYMIFLMGASQAMFVIFRDYTTGDKFEPFGTPFESMMAMFIMNLGNFDNIYAHITQNRHAILGQWAKIVLVMEQSVSPRDRIEGQLHYSQPFNPYGKGKKTGARGLAISWYQTRNKLFRSKVLPKKF